MIFKRENLMQDPAAAALGDRHSMAEVEKHSAFNTARVTLNDTLILSSMSSSPLASPLLIGR